MVQMAKEVAEAWERERESREIAELERIAVLLMALYRTSSVVGSVHR